MRSELSRVRRSCCALLVVAVGVALAQAPAALASEVLDPAGTSFTATASEPFSGSVATFTASVEHSPASFSATVDWGDATTPTAGVIVDLGVDPDDDTKRLYRIDGTHEYATAGTVPTDIAITFGVSDEVHAAGTATVRAAIQQPAATPLATTAGTPFAGGVATFASPVADPTHFSATVSWGDGTPTSGGTIVLVGQDPDDPTLSRYRVDSEHVYGAAGGYAVEVAVQHLAVPAVVMATTATVAAPATTGSQPAAGPPAPTNPSAPAPQPIRPPEILGARFTPAPKVGRRSVFEIRAIAPDAPVNGYVVSFGEGGARVGASACALLRGFGTGAADPFSPGVARLSKLSYTFRKRGRHTVGLTVTSGRCDGQQVTASRTLSVLVGARPKPRRSTATAASTAGGRGRAAQAAPATCEHDTLEPDGTNNDLVSAAALCLINAERAAARVPVLKVDTRLASSAKAHNSAMVEGRFFEHQGPSEPGLGERAKKAGYTGGLAENIGYGGGRLSTAKVIVQAWMDSPPHRANILERDYVGVGISVIEEAPTGARKPGSSYTANFGTAEVTPGVSPPTTTPATGPGGGPLAGAGGGLLAAIPLTLAPRSFRASASGPPTPVPATAGTSLAFKLPAAGTVTFTVRRKQAGRRVGRTCAKPRRSNRRKRTCTRTPVVGSFRVAGTAGANALRFSGRIKGRRLAPGAYLMEIVATDASGRRTTPRTTPFAITR